jgi:hypothetical protein
LCTRAFWVKSNPQPKSQPPQQYALLNGEEEEEGGVSGPRRSAAAAACIQSVDGIPVHLEPLRSSRLQAGVVITNLRKVFYYGNPLFNWLTASCRRITGRQHRGKGDDGMEVVAVNNLNLSLYENEISCLLGHNGAGL